MRLINKFDNFYINLSKKISKSLKSLSGSPSQNLKKSVEILEWDIKPESIVASSKFLFLLSFVVLICMTMVFAFLGLYNHYFVLGAIILPILINHAFTEYPKMRAKEETISSLAYAPSILTSLVVNLKQNPNLEKAILFVAKHEEGKIAGYFKKLLTKSWSGKRINFQEELIIMGNKWSHIEGFKRAMYLIRSSFSEKFEERRLDLLDKALDTALSSIIEKTRLFCSELMLPTMILFTFGAVLPLIIISLLPILFFLGFKILNPANIISLLVLTLFGIYFYSNRISSNRPIAFEAVKIPRLPGMPKKGSIRLKFRKTVLEAPAVLYSVLIGLTISLPGIFYLLGQSPLISFSGIIEFLTNKFNTLTIVWGFGAGLAVYLWGSSYFKKKIRDEAKQLENEILDALYQIGGRIEEYRAPEEAIEHVSKMMQGTKIGKLFLKASLLIKKRNFTLKKAFFGKEGVLKNVFSPTIHSIMKLFVNSLDKGTKPASETLFTITRHFGELEKTERDLKNMLFKNLSMVKATILIFAPVACGLIVTLQQLMQSGMDVVKEKLISLGFSPMQAMYMPTIPVPMLQLISGFYMLCLGIILTRYITVLQAGKDEVETKLSIAKAIPIMLFIFSITLLASRVLLL